MRRRDRGVSRDVSWCALYFDGTYSGQDACFRDRKARPEGSARMPWIFGDATFPADSETRNGTEAVCLAIEKPDTRTDCFRSREPAPWREPFAPDCPADQALVDERCLGAQGWCERQAGVYGSVGGCLSLRRPRPAPRDLPWQHGDGCAPQSERCLGAVGWRAEHWHTARWLDADEHACLDRRCGLDARRLESVLSSAVADMLEPEILDVALNGTVRALIRELVIRRQPRRVALDAAKSDNVDFLQGLRRGLLRDGKAERAIKARLAPPQTRPLHAAVAS